MSVYTTVSDQTLADFLTRYELGTLVSHQGISAGVENTNYFVTTSIGEYVLTLVESTDKARLALVLDFIRQLNQAEFPCVKLARQKSGQLFSQLNERPALLMERLPGVPLDTPTLTQCQHIGGTLAQLHLLDIKVIGIADEDISNWCTLKVGEPGYPLNDESNNELTADQQQLLEGALATAESIAWQHLPTGLIHGDLFPDNSLFEGNQLSGIIDFYHTCRAPFLYDLAVTLNAWSYSEVDQSLNEEKAKALMENYLRQRPLLAIEQNALAAMRVTAALRFWLSRLEAKLFPNEGAAVTRKDPQAMEQLLKLLLNALG